MSQKAVPSTIPAHWSFVLLPGLQLLGLIFFSRVQEPALYSFFLISLFASWRLFSDGRPYSLNKLWWLFCLIFLSLHPSIAYVSERGISIKAPLLETNVVILTSMLLYEGIRLWASFNFVPQPEGSPPSVPGVLLRQYAHFAPAIVLGSGAAAIVLFGIQFPWALNRQATATWLIVALPLLRATMLWCSVAAIILYRQHRLGTALLLLVLIPAILFNLPIAMPESIWLTFLMAWLLASGRFTLRRTHVLSWMLIVYFVLVAPLLGVLRASMYLPGYGTQTSDWRQQFVLANSWQSLNLSMQHFGSMQPGRPLMGAVLFFVPEYVWPNKPDGSALLLAKAYPSEPVQGCTLLAEGFLNFGIWGACIFAASLALVIASYDGWYWRRGGHLRFTLLRLFYFASFGLLFCLLQGDLQFAFFNGTLFLSGFVFWQGLFFWRIIGPKYQLHY